MKKYFPLTLISAAILSQSALAADEFVNYTGPDRNPVRTVEEQLKYQEIALSDNFSQFPKNHGYPENSYYGVSFSDEGTPAESIISLGIGSTNYPTKLNIENYHFTLDKAFSESSVIYMKDDAEVRFTNGTVTVGSNIQAGSDFDQHIVVFEQQDGTKLTLKNIDVNALDGKTELTISQLIESSLNIDNLNIKVKNDQNKIIFDLENAELNAQNLMVNSSGQKGYNLGFLMNNSYASLKNADVTINSNDKIAAVFALNDANVDIVDSKINAKGTAVLFSNFQNNELAKRPQTQVNLKNSSLLSDDTLLELDGKISRLWEEGDEDSFTSPRFNIQAENSTLKGRVVNNNPELTNEMSLTNHSKWMMTGDSTLSKLENTDSEVIFEQGGFHTLTLKALSGNGKFNLRTDLANQQSDQIVVEGNDEGNHGLIIRDSGNEPKAANGKVTLVKTYGQGTALFRLQDREYVDAGAYRYRLRKEGNNWVLSNQAAERSDGTSTTPSTNINTSTGSNTSTGATGTTSTMANPATPNHQQMLSEKTNALVSLRQAQLVHMEQELAGIHQRLGELKGKDNQVWVRNLNSRSKFSATNSGNNSQTSGFKQDYNGLQVGADRALSPNFHLGGFVTLDQSYVDFKGNYASGKIKGKGFGIYATYYADNGIYWDNVARFSHLKTQSKGSDKRSYQAYSLSTELGKQFNLADQWTITPNAQLAWTTISSKADEERLSSIYTRLGLRAAKTIDLGEWKLQPYSELNGIYAQNHSKVRVNQYQFDVAPSRSRLEMALGLNAQFGQHRFGVEAKNTQGKHLDQPFSIQAVYRYQW